MELSIQTRPHLTAPPLARAEIAAAKLLSDVGRPNAEISVVLTDDAEIRQLNRQWRSLDKPTDVLSWPLEEIGEESPLNAADDFSDVLGDVVISLETASRQASARNWELSDEVALLLIHGVLHLLGHEDETEAGADAMKAIEEKLLGKPLEKV